MKHKVTLRKRLDRVLAEGHPWIFRDALEGELPEAGQVVTVVDRAGEFLARGLAEAGPIGVRVFVTRDSPVDSGLFANRIRAACALRDRVVPTETNAYRLLHGEGDRLPGVVCDVYAGYAVLTLDGQAVTAWQSTLVDALWPVLSDRGVDHLLFRAGRGPQLRVEALRGQLPDGTVEVLEYGMRLPVDLVRGQKTGLFLDHRESRHRVRRLARGSKVLNLYSYTGGFSIAAGLGGAVAVDSVDSAAPACALADQGWSDNGLSPEDHTSHPIKVQPFLEEAARQGQRWDLIVADPPSFAPSEKKVRGAMDTYRNLHRAVLGLLGPGGLYLAASCSSHIQRESFEKTILEAARRSDQVLQVLDRWGAPADHPRLAAFPEGDYLKVVLARLAP